MKRLLRWLLKKDLEAAKWEGYREGSKSVLDALKASKLFMFGEAPIKGLNEFLAKEMPNNLTIMGCTFDGENSREAGLREMEGNEVPKLR